ncbi:hypothetical protein BDE36_2506 [Arcticibacter tournemirensis]|uniref:PH domain-containing protein n=1 Tax=Arcticibacter tournemirensis TaxID=699437 RepID=A0A5M9GZF7_9SPHI|nr:hypothetical protein [Arcticibacter tournemirensis]KAA8478228.1 hypothetical protein F1649_17995 [Arcticibacter tournemirensis]TQM50745.1 hypothetical protein BDE36_2506 [Arcticibacter tournemirensis]
MKYIVTVKKHFMVLESAIIGHVLLIAMIFYFYCLTDNQDGVLVILGVTYLISMLPAFFLHIEYYTANKHDTVDIDTLSKTITFNDGQPVSFNDVEKVVLYMPPVWHRKGFIRLLPFEDYHYAKIMMKSGEQFTFTCLLASKVEEVMKTMRGVLIEKKKRVIASALFE